MKPELLSPAGGPEAGYAALAYGADAVYLGLERFSARAEAENFDLRELDTLAAYAHSLSPRRRVYVTVNTLVLEAELPELVATLASLTDLGVDAVIVQDLGVARVVRRHFPALELHASTQMAVHSLAGVEALARLGVRRVVAARELTLDEIRGLCRQPDVEIECFVHGAVCYAYSGLCLFSSHALGRSANRGRCAYLCGGSFTEEGRAGASALPFAMKDLALGDRLGELADAGVASLKIEGRKKSALYVAAVTDLYRSLLDGTLGPEERREREADLRTIFSRPWTELYLSSPRQGGCGEPDRVGHRGAAVGSVSAVAGSRRTGTLLRFRTSRALEVHDGLQVEIPGHVKPFGFAIEALRVAGSSETRFEVPAGTEVEVPLPPGHPLIPVGSEVCCASSQAVKRAFRWAKPREGEHRVRRAVDVRVRLAPSRVEAEATTAGEGPSAAAAQVLVGAYGPARDPQAAADGVRAAFERLGNTPFRLGELAVENPGGLYAAPSQWNRLRRAVTEALEAALVQARVAEVQAILGAVAAETAAAPAEGATRWSLKVDRLDVLEGFGAAEWEGLDELVVSLEALDRAGAEGLDPLADLVGRDRVRLALPPVMRAWDEARLLPLAARLRDRGWRRWEIANLAGWRHLGLAPGKPGGLDLTADWPLYVLNSAAGKELLDLGLTGFALSPEDGADNLKKLLGVFGGSAAVIVYQHTPLFVSETCPRATLAGSCPGPGNCGFEPLDLVSDFGDRVRVLSRNCRTTVVSRAPFCLSQHLSELAAAGARSFRLDLQWGEETAEEGRALWQRLREGLPIDGAHEGNYARGLR